VKDHTTRTNLAPMLYNEPFVAVFPSLVRELQGDVTAAAVLQHIHFRANSLDAVELDNLTFYPVSVENLAEQIGISPKQIKRVITKLRENDYLDVQQLGGIDRRNFYRVVMDSASSIGPSGTTPLVPNGTHGRDPNGAYVLSTNKNKEVVKEYIHADDPESDLQSITKPVDTPGFTEFWETYPLRTAKPAARKAFIKAIKNTPSRIIIVGAANYANDPNRDPRYTAHAATWLNNERWNDDPIPSRSEPPKSMQRTRDLMEWAAMEDQRLTEIMP